MTNGPDYLKEWKIGDDIYIVFDDLTKTERSKEEINQLFLNLQAAAKASGFELKMWGLKITFEKSIEKTLSRKKWDEGARAMLQKLINEKMIAAVPVSTIELPQYEA